MQSKFLDTCWKFPNTLQKLVPIWKFSNTCRKFPDTQRKLWAIWLFWVIGYKIAKSEFQDTCWIFPDTRRKCLSIRNFCCHLIDKWYYKFPDIPFQNVHPPAGRFNPAWLYINYLWNIYKSQKFPGAGQKCWAKSFVVYNRNYYHLHVHKKIPDTCPKCLEGGKSAIRRKMPLSLSYNTDSLIF